MTLCLRNLTLLMLSIVMAVMGASPSAASAQEQDQWTLEFQEPAPNIQFYTLQYPVLRYPEPSHRPQSAQDRTLTEAAEYLNKMREVPNLTGYIAYLDAMIQEGPADPNTPIEPRRWGDMDRETELDYQHEGTNLRGLLVEPAGQAKGTVLIVHAWKGLGDEEKERARMLAKLGYRAFALDMYGAGVYAKDTDEAAKRAGEFYGNRQLMRGRVRAAMDALKDKNKLGDKVAAIGYCFGGTVVLECARAGFDLDAVVSFHGGLKFESAPRRGQVTASVLVCNGYADPYVTIEDRQAFKREMEQADADFVFIDYADAVHSFTSKSAGPPAEGKGAAYDETADKRSWTAMQGLFEEKMD